LARLTKWLVLLDAHNNVTLGMDHAEPGLVVAGNPRCSAMAALPSAG
jgi:hypothetical protein